MANIAELWVRIGADIRGLQTGLAAAKGNVAAFGRSAQAQAKGTAGAFSGMQGVMVAAAAVGAAAAVKMAVDFETSMNKIAALVGVGEQQLEQLSEGVLDLAKDLPASPIELADALFYVTSAGKRGAEAMDILKLAGQGAAIGLGETKVVADVLTSAMNAYAASGLTATRATDILIAAVRAGKFAPEELAGSLGSVLPTANLLSVSFDQVAASIAAMSRQGMSVPRAATSIRFLLTSFIKPSQEAVAALGSIGLSIRDVQDMLAQQGLLATLQELARRFDLSTAAGKQAFATVVGGARGASAALLLVNDSAGETEKLFRQVADSAGVTKKALEEASKRTQFQFGLLKSSVEVLAIQIGTALLPVANKVLQILSKGLNAIAPLLKLVADHAGLVATAFAGWAAFRFVPALLAAINVRLVTFIGLRVAPVVAAIGNAFHSLAAGIAAGTISLEAFAVAASGALPTLVALAAAVLSLKFAWEQWERLQAIRAENERQDINLRIASAQAAAVAAVQTGVLTQAHIDAVRAVRGHAGATRALASFQDILRGALQRGAISVRDYRSWMQAVGLTVDEAAIEQAKLAAATRNASEEAAGAVASLRALSRQLAGLAADAKLPAEAMGVLGPALAEVEAGLDHLAMVSGIDTSRIIADFRAVATDTSKSMGDVRAAAREMVSRTHELWGQWHDQIVQTFGGAGSALADFANQSNVSITEAIGALDRYTAQIRRFGRDIERIQDRFGHRADDFLNWAQQQGLAQAGLVSAVANASKGAAREFVRSWTTAQDATENLATQIQEALAPVFRGILQQLKSIRRALGGLPPLKLKDEATRPLAYIQYRLDRLVRPHDVPVGIDDRTVRPRERIAAHLDRLRGPHDVKVGLDRSRFDAGLDTLMARLHDLTSRVRTVKVGYATVAHGGGLVRHAGGRVLAPMVPASAEVTSYAMRMHGGGLGPDDVPAILQRGEFVIRASSAQKIGLPVLEALNRMHEGGPVETEPVLRVAGMRDVSRRRSEEDLKVKLYVDRRKFGRDLDADALVRGW